MELILGHSRSVAVAHTNFAMQIRILKLFSQMVG